MAKIIEMSKVKVEISFEELKALVLLLGTMSTADFIRITESEGQGELIYQIYKSLSDFKD